MTDQKEISVLIADDQPMVRAGIKVMLEASGMIVIAEAENGRDAIDLANQHRPDVCLMDIRMPGVDGLEATRQLAGPHLTNPIPVVVVTTFDQDDYVHQAIRNGASGFILKDAGPNLLIEAVRAAIRGDALISPSITVRLLGNLAGTNLPEPAKQPAEPLSEREEEVLKLVATGKTNSEIADTLYISLATAKTHLNHLSNKIGARNRVELAAWAWDTGRMNHQPKNR
ncbi:MAG: response regulator [Acidimicrobiales bacterium]